VILGLLFLVVPLLFKSATRLCRSLEKVSYHLTVEAQRE